MAYGRRGTEFVVNKKVAGDQYSPAIAGFSSGGFIVVWETSDTLQDGSGRAVMAQRYDSLGNAVGSEILVNTSTTVEQRAPSVTTLASGGYVVTWETSDTTQDGSGTAIKGQLFDSAGAPVGAEFRVNSQLALNQTVPSISGLEGGGFVVTWRTSDTTQDGLGGAIKGQVYNASGVAVGGEFLVNAAGFASELTPAVSGIAGGGFVATWVVNGGSQGDIYAQIFNSSGAKVGGQFLVNTTTALGQEYPAVSQISGGRFVITWDSSVSTSQFDSEIRARIFSADGTPLGNDFVVSTSRVDPGSGIPSDAYQPQVDDLPNGGFFITWTLSSGLANRSSIRGQYFDSNGNKVGSEVLVSTVTDRFEERGDVAVDGNGSVFAVWGSVHGSGSAGGEDIHGQVYSPNGAPAIVSNGGGDVVTLSVAENQKAVTTVSAVDPEGSLLVYSIVGGPDASFFTINASTGALSFITEPNFEFRLDWDNNKTFDVVVSVTDGVMTDIQALTVAITDVDEAPVFQSSQTNYTLVENGTAVGTFFATDPEGKAVTWSIAGGVDAARFVIDSAGVLRFVAAPNFEAPADVGANNIYNVTIGASDGSNMATRALAVQVTNLNEGPVIISAGGADAASFSVAENTGLVTTIVADDPDAQDDYGFAIVGGADAALFTIGVANGVLQFKSPRDFEAPADSDGNNVYEVIVAVRDFVNSPDTQTIFVTVTNANDAPVITSSGGGALASVSMSENQLNVTTVTAVDVENGPLAFSIAGGADAALFAIDAQTGLLSFVAAPDREAPRDSGANHVYNVTVAVSDGDKSATQQLSITVLDVNEAPVITSNGGAAAAALTVAENMLAVTSVAAADPEGRPLSYAITGGADSSRFAVDAATGALSFLAAPDREQPRDSNGDNVYDVTVSASDGVLSASQALSITVANVNEGVTITSGAAPAVAENSTAVMNVTAQDLDGDAVSFAITGGADAHLFAIDPASGALRFLAAPDFEAPADFDGNNVYDVTVTASDGALAASRALAVTVTNQNEAIAFVSGGGGDHVSVAINENSGRVLDLLAADPDGGTVRRGVVHARSRDTLASVQEPAGFRKSAGFGRRQCL
jgi:Cadherin domain